jgi:hypothetical protein
MTAAAATFTDGMLARKSAGKQSTHALHSRISATAEGSGRLSAEPDFVHFPSNGSSRLKPAIR